MSENCGAPTRYWRIGLDQTNTKTNGQVHIAEVYMGNLPGGSGPNLLAAAGTTVTLDHVPGVYEVTAPLDGSSNPILDGAVLVDNDVNSIVILDIVNSQTPTPWYINIDLGSGNETTIGSIGIQLISHHRASARDLILSVEGSADNSTWYVVERVRINPAAMGSLWKTTLAGRGDVGRDIPAVVGGFSGFIPGIVSEDSVVKPNNRVFCFERDTMKLVARGLSDLNGNYIFYGLDTAKKYMVVAVDDDGSPFKQPSAWDHVVPTKGELAAPMDLQTYQNRQAITGFKCNGIYLPATLPSQVRAVGMSDMYNYSTYTENPFSGKYGVYNEDNSLTQGTVTPLRTDQQPVKFVVKTHGYRQIIALAQGGINATGGFAVELCVTPVSDFWVCLNGFSSRFRQWHSWFGNSSEYGFYYTGYNNDRTLEEVSYIQIAGGSVRVIFRTVSLGRIDFTIPLSPSINDGNIHHVVVTVEAGVEARVYVDGALVGSHSIAGSGDLVTDVVWNTNTSSTSYSNEAGNPAVIGPVRLVTNPSHSGPGSPGYTVFNWYLANVEYSLLATYTEPLSPTEVSDLYSEAIGTYPDIESLPNVSGHTAAVLVKAPTYYFPMQDDLSTITATNPVLVYPGPGRTIASGTSGQSTFPANYTDGVISSVNVPGSSRVWLKFNAGVDVSSYNAYMAFPNFSSTDEMTVMVWTRFSSLPPTANASLVSFYGIYQEYATLGSAKGKFNGTLVSVRVTPAGEVVFIYKLYTNNVSLVTVNTGYIIPLDTNIHLCARIDATTASVSLLVNGAQVFSTPFGGKLHLGHAARVYHVNSSAGMYLRDLALFNRALSDSEINDLYTTGV